MAIPFSHSTRSLEADSFTTSLISLILAMTLLLAWNGWFFLARVTLYEVGSIVRVDEDDMVIAKFPPSSQGQILPRQTAIIRLNVPSEIEPIIIPAMVTGVMGENGQVELYAFWNDQPMVNPQAGLTGQVEVEVEYVSPATLVMRTTGQVLNARKVSDNPRIPQD